MVRVRAWEYFHLDPKKVFGFSLVLGLSGGSAVLLLTRDVLESSSLPLSILMSSFVFYFGLSFPGRLAEAARLAQSREAPALAVMGAASLEATHSRTKAILLLRSGDRDVSATLLGARRRILQGYPADVAVIRGATLASSSAEDVLRSIASPERTGMVEGGEESQGIVQSSQLSDESKLPMFTAVAFFAPIMLLLYVIMSHVGEPTRLAEVVALQVVILDIAFYFSSADRWRLG